MNTKLIEKLIMGDVAFFMPQNNTVDNLRQFNILISQLFKNGEWSFNTMWYKFYFVNGKVLDCSDTLPEGMTAYPLNDFLEEDKSGLDLKEMERLTDEALSKETPESLKQYLAGQRKENKQPENKPGTTFTQLLAEEKKLSEAGKQNFFELIDSEAGDITVKVSEAQAAADKYADLKMAELAEWMNKNGIHYFKDGKWWFGTKGHFTTAELIQIFNAENNGR